METADPAVPPHPPTRRGTGIVSKALATFAVVNVLLLLIVWLEQGGAALTVAYIFSPLFNAAVAVGFVAAALRLGRRRPEAPVARAIAAVLGLGILAVGGVILAVRVMPLVGGC